MAVLWAAKAIKLVVATKIMIFLNILIPLWLCGGHLAAATGLVAGREEKVHGIRGNSKGPKPMFQVYGLIDPIDVQCGTSHRKVEPVRMI